MALSPEEQTHYNRHLILPGFGSEAQEKLKNASVLIIGAGGLGCPALLYLVGAGVGTIGIADDDVVGVSNLHRQILFTTEDIGKPKAKVAANRLAQNNPHVQIIPIQKRLNVDNVLALLQDYDFVIDGSDNFSTRYLVNDACVIQNKPFVSGAIFTFEGQVSVFNYQDGPTYRCLFPEPPAADEMPNCSEIGVLGVLPGVVGTIMATEAIKLIAGIGEVLSGKLLVYNALSMSFHHLGFETKWGNKSISRLVEYDFSCNLPNAAMEISAEQLKDWQKRGIDFQLLDVREPNEFEHFNIQGINAPLSELDKHLEKISRTAKVVVHCQAGARSQRAIKLLNEKYGFSNLINLKNGLLDW